VRDTRLRALSAAGAEVIALIWRIGALILERQDQGWGARVIDRLSKDLQAQFPRRTGLSPTNMQYSRAFAVAWAALGTPPLYPRLGMAQIGLTAKPASTRRSGPPATVTTTLVT